MLQKEGMTSVVCCADYNEFTRIPKTRIHNMMMIVSN